MCDDSQETAISASRCVMMRRCGPFQGVAMRGNRRLTPRRRRCGASLRYARLHSLGNWTNFLLSSETLHPIFDSQLAGSLWTQLAAGSLRTEGAARRQRRSAGSAADTPPPRTRQTHCSCHSVCKNSSSGRRREAMLIYFTVKHFASNCAPAGSLKP